MVSKSFLKQSTLNTPNTICEIIIIPDETKIDKKIKLLFKDNNFSFRLIKDDKEETDKGKYKATYDERIKSGLTVDAAKEKARACATKASEEIKTADEALDTW